MRNLIAGITLVACAAFAPAAVAQESRDDDPTVIVVEGARDRDQQVRRFVDALTDVPIRGQIGRHERDVCPAAMGLRDSQNVEVARRMRRVAEAAGIPLGEEGCRPNAILVVTRDKGAFVEALSEAYPDYFAYMSPQDIRRLARTPGPAVAWQAEGRVTADGLAVARDSLTGAYISSGAGLASRIRTATRPHFLASVVVVEVDATQGLTVTQLADYAAMRAFADVDPSRLDDSEAPTILTAVEASDDTPIPITLTQWDLAYLRALYGSAENHYASHQRGEMRRMIERELDTEAEE